MRFSLLIVLCFSFCIAQAQNNTIINGVIRDNQTNESIVGAIIKVGDQGAITDTNGKYAVSVPASQTITISAIGYFDKTIKINAGQNNIETKLSRTFVTLDSAQVTAKKFSIDSLFIKAANNASQNYLSSAYVLNATYNMQLYKAADTTINYSRPIFLYNKNEDWFNYDFHRVKGDTGTGKFDATNKVYRNYCPYVPTYYGKDIKDQLEKYVGTADRLQYILSTYMDKGEKYYDLIFINPDKKVQYTAVGKLMGYTDNKNANVARRYIMLTEYQFSARTYAMIFQRSVAIEIKDKDSQTFLKLKGRNEMEDWINEGISANKKFFVYSSVFNTWMNKYYLQHVYYRDNLVHPLLKNMPLEDYTYKVSFDVNSIGTQLPDNTDKFSLLFYLAMKTK